MTDRSFLIKIIPPKGYDVYRLRISRAGLVASVVALIAIALGALAVHAWQLHAAENAVQALQAQAAAQRAQINDIDRQADDLAGQLRELQRENVEIRKLLGGGAAATHAPTVPRVGPSHAQRTGAPTLAEIQSRLRRLARFSAAEHADVARLDRLTHRVLDLRRIARIARARLIAALPSLNPVGGSIASAFGWRVDPWPEFHQGVDLEADYGTPVHASAAGTVVSAAFESGFGNKVALDHGNGYQTWYAHLSRFAVTPGQHVRKGDVIAFVGATGDATGPHLHYQVMRDGQPIDPTPFLTGVPASVLASLPAESAVQ